ncbi:MAG: hypothetical protein HYS12_23100 [Planctomycetes bacterium]|nr:hypothetical protein [Planctomycetota bacterium]
MSDPVPHNEITAANGQQPSQPGTTPAQDQLPRESRISPELREWLLRRFSEEEAVANLRELREKGGLELWDFIEELEQGLRDGEPTE